MKQLALIKWIIALVLLTGAATQLGFAQATDSRGTSRLELMAKLEVDDTVCFLAFSPDGKTLAAIDHGSKLRLWNIAERKARVILDDLIMQNLVFGPDGKILALAGGPESLEIWDVSNVKKLITLKGRPADGDLECVSFSPDGKVMATGGFRFGHLRTCTGIVTLREPKDGKVQKTVKIEDPVRSADFSPDGKTLALATGDRSAGLKMTVTSWSELAALEFGTGGHGIRWRPHGKLKIMEIPTSKILKSLTAHDDSTEIVKFSPDGRILATGGGDGAVKLWDVATWKEQCKLKGQENAITSLAFSPDSKLLASADRYSVKLWDVASKREFPDLSNQLKGGNGVAFAPQGCMLATGTGDEKHLLFNPNRRQEVADNNAIRLWRVQISQEQKQPK